MDQDSFRNLALAELEAVHRLAHHLASRPQEVDDLVQETYLRAFRYGGGFVLGEHGIRPWLFKILHNVLSARLAKDRRQPASAEDLADQPAAGGEHANGWADDLARIDWDRVDERLKHGIADLPPEQRCAFLLSAVEGLRYREIADVTDVPIGTVMSRLHRARRTLIGRLGAWAADQGHAGRRQASSSPATAPRRPAAEVATGTL